MIDHRSIPAARSQGGDFRCAALVRLVGAFVLVIFEVGTVWAAEDAAFVSNLENAVAKAEATSMLDSKTKWREKEEAAKNLADVPCKTGVGLSEKVPSEIIARIIALLNTDDDGARGFVAATLGCLGPQAKAAIPKFLEILPEVNCVRADLNSAGAILLAMERMGVTPPPTDCK